MTDDQVLDYIAFHYRTRSNSDAKLIRGFARFAELRQPKRSGIDLGDGAAEEVAMELCLSPNTAAIHLSQSRSIVARLPTTVDALEAGEIDYTRTKAMHDYTADLTADQAAEVEKRVLDGGKRENLTRFKHALRRTVIRVDPQGAEQRRQEARSKRDVTKWDKPDGTATLNITLDPHETSAAYQQINTMAMRCKTPGRTLAQRRADVFMDLVLGKETTRPPVTVNVLIPMTTLLGLNQEPGEITGYGPITAEYARELAHDATWRRVITDPTGQVLEVSRRRFASPALKRHIELRDRTCRQPGCTVPADRCQTDHTTTYATGGLTSLDNTSTFCKRHNLMRQRTDWKLDQPTPGTLVFHTPANRKLVTHPQPYEPAPF
ncbi:HNH endonuclease signature motif containing protein [Kibdelosporangium phytohabitans]|uniref:HNH nuclease domain-containing protein n=1 Tax=Kibdelosporangium phytohabitans TaxID=860235 RepID=A0A0N9HZJ5_9PSEU|nr:HNH endonuclease signature motif containing protein [Kibdelosporangium phytohabitans]ALG08940.1 hypothetical protein AOZ06_20285 [Kibdelosporangium phytohabitans]MBE1469897.1 hypothetical protein [Kibdelosporangium phytohabitans]